jgi:SpoVK/Ycf46/Vps4 family AAA+-type ATPase
VIFEDLDKLVQSENVSLSDFLNVLDGLQVLDGVLVIATTNEPGRLDPALLQRPSRFDRVWTFPVPDASQRLLLLQKKGRPYFSDRVLEEVAEKSTNFTMAYVQEILVNALLNCAHDGRDPDDASLMASLKTLKAQRKAASKLNEPIGDRETLGFQPDFRKLFRLRPGYDQSEERSPLARNAYIDVT